MDWKARFNRVSLPLPDDADYLAQLAADIRAFLVSSVSQTGGHIGANLGTIELTLALHVVFKSPEAAIIFDTGHQGYTHKILTQRAHLFDSLNSFQGMNRFLTPDESHHDLVETSHAGTAISTGLGLAVGRKLAGDQNPVVSVVGDAAFAEGNSLEAINHALVSETQLIVVINDNGFAISEGFGALHNLLGNDSGETEAFFRALGANYSGPIDGHDTPAIVAALRNTGRDARLNIVHVRTTKGRGLTAAEAHPTRMHYSPPFDVVTGAPSGPPQPLAFSDAVGTFLLEQMSIDPMLFCVTPSTRYATGLDAVFEEYPDRCVDPGMAEQHAMSFCVGLEKAGLLPIISYQSTFMQRAFDQLVHDIAFSRTKAIILAHRTGLAGYDNATHHGLLDSAVLRAVPGLRIFRPSSLEDFTRLFLAERATISGPVMFLLPYGPVKEFPDFHLSRSVDSEELRSGSGTLLVSVGNMLGIAASAAEIKNCGLVDLRRVAPLDAERLLHWARRYDRVVVLEEATKSGGVGQAIAASFAEQTNAPNVEVFAYDDGFLSPGSREDLSSLHGLDLQSVLDRLGS